MRDLRALPQRFAVLALMIVVPIFVTFAGCSDDGGERTTDPPADLPVIFSIQPDTVVEGTTVWIRGERFGAAQGQSRILFGSRPAQSLRWNETRILAVVPDGVAPAGLTVAVGDRTSDPLPYQVANKPPRITGLDHDSGEAGETIVLEGALFGADQRNGRILFGAIEAATVAWADTSIQAIVPEDAHTGTLRVEARSLASNEVPFRVLEAPEPVLIMRLEPARTTVLDLITIHGTGFRTGSLEPVITFQGSQVRIDGELTAFGEGTLQVRVPQEAVDGPVIVRFGDQASNEAAFSVAPRRIGFTADVRPLFQAKSCLACHAGTGASGSLVLSSRADVLRGDSDHGPVVLGRNGPVSPLVLKVGPNPPFGSRMPLGCTTGCLSAEEILVLTDWIDQGMDE